MNRRPCQAQQSARRRGFTLMEILIVMAVLVLLAGITWPAMESQITVAQLPESAARLRDLCYMARVEATKEYRRVRIRFVPGEQQPRIEIERDPILYVDEWSPVETPWAQQAMEGVLLSNVQVHSIRPGRPDWTKPISLNDNPDPKDDEKGKNRSFERDDIDALDTEEILAYFDATAAKSKRDGNGEPLDENRPIIEFAADGSSDWALIVLAQRPPEEELEVDDPVRWVLLDGRNGLASVREPLSDEDLINPDLYVMRENLYPPDLSDLGRLTLTSTGFGGQPATDEDGDGIPDAPADPEDGGDPPGMEDGGGDDGFDEDDLPKTPSDLEDALNNSDLSSSERDAIRNALNGAGGGNGRGDTGGGRSGGNAGAGGAGNDTGDAKAGGRRPNGGRRGS